MVIYLEDATTLENYICDYCEESALVVTGNFPAGWYAVPPIPEIVNGVIHYRDPGVHYCPGCRGHKED
jgi:hypothetical protein